MTTQHVTPPLSNVGLTDRVFSNDEYMDLLRKLDTRHTVFYQMWLSGVPRFSRQIATAAVAFDDVGQQIDFVVNPEFWDAQTEVQKQFVLCHECLHIILEHGSRFFANPKVDHDIANKATDVAINHMTVNKLGFVRSEIDPENVYCWTDTVFPTDHDVPQDKSAEWYYLKLIKQQEESDGDSSIGSNTVDSHEFLNSGIPGDSSFDEFIKRIADSLDDEEKNLIRELLDADHPNTSSGTSAGGGKGVWSTTVDTTSVKKKQKWETVIKKWALQYLRTVDKEESQWTRINRRFVMLSDDMFIPTDMEIEEEEKKEERIQVWFFQDTSGSCSGYHQRFFDAAKSLPEERFDVRMFCFDDRVYETSLESGRLYGFGGTSFHIIESAIQRTIHREKIDYPKAIFVITDGWGTNVYPKKPENWYWFLTPYNSKSYIPKSSHVFNLTDYE